MGNRAGTALRDRSDESGGLQELRATLELSANIRTTSYGPGIVEESRYTPTGVGCVRGTDSSISRVNVSQL